MKIYTRKGDRGETALFGGKRIGKDSPRINAYGHVDELNSILGIVRSLKPRRDVDNIIQDLQGDLFVLGADLSTPRQNRQAKVPRIHQSNITALERTIDLLEHRLSPLRSFILPGGTELAAQLHFARTVCRKAERSIVHLSKKEAIGEEIPSYVNRLSDLLFVLARYANRTSRRKEILWHSRRSAKR